MNASRFIYLSIFSVIIFGCHPRSDLLEPRINFIPARKHISALPSIQDFEQDADWKREIKIGQSLAKDLDLYRAITAFKRGLILMPEERIEERLLAEFYIVKAYWLGQKYESALESFEFSHLPQAKASFTAFGELIQILYDCYQKTGATEQADKILRLIEKGDRKTALDFNLYAAINRGDLASISSLARKHPREKEFRDFITTFRLCKKSVKTAQILNALLPGLGYYYVGQKKSALTSFVINTLFIAAAGHFFERGNWGAGLIAASLEFGWYFGGINGSGLAAKEYNEYLYNTMGRELMIKTSLFPVLTLETSF